MMQARLVNPIAVIGVSCRLPGASDLEAFTSLLQNGVDAITEIPPDRWTRGNTLHPDPKQAGRSYTLAAGILPSVDLFDAAFFGISPREAAQMDPQQRLLLELTHEALESAGMPGRVLAGSRTGVYVGGSSSDYMALRLGDMSAADAYFMTGSTLSTLSNRISYIFDLRGPSFTVDTACSSSLVALHLACTAITRGETDMAFVGGVNLLLSPQSFVGFSRASMLSPRGRCHAFAKGADGYVRAEGGGVFLLKPLAQALADGDPIRAVIEATGVNSDGRTSGLSMPSRRAQAALLREIYGVSNIDPNDLVYVEAHGTGTAVGDPIEAGALGDALGRHRVRPLPIGSVKTNIGHLEAASGMAGMLKAILVLRDGIIPASLHCATPNPDIDFETLNLELTPQARVAESAGLLRKAAVNSFGFGGTNAHVVFSEAPRPETLKMSSAAAPSPRYVQPLLISAKSDAALASLVQSWRSRLDGMPMTEAAPLLRAASRGREHHSQRLVASGTTTTEIVSALDAYVTRRADPNLSVGTALASAEVVFVYSGNGSQWAGMAEDGLRNHVFRVALEEVEAELAPLVGWSLMDCLLHPDAAAMRRTDVAQPLLFAVQHASVQALRAAGVAASAHLGHSVGEVAAALNAGALSLKDAARVIAVRSAAQERTVQQGGMAALGLGPEEAAALLERVPGVEIAAINGRHAVTVAGPKAALRELESLTVNGRPHFVMLDLDYAFHSAAMEPIRTGLLRDLNRLTSGPARERFYSTVTGAAHNGTGLGAEYWWLNVRNPVRFAGAVSAAIADGCRILLEIGPNPVLQSYLRDGLSHAQMPGRAMATLSRKVQAGDPFSRIAGEIHVAGHNVSNNAVFTGAVEAAALDALPAYPWQRQRYWYEATDEATDMISARCDHPLLGMRRGTEPSLWHNTLGTSSEPWLADHAVDGMALLPATAIVEIALAAARACWPESSCLDVLDLEITRPLLLESQMVRETRFSVTDQRGTFEFASRSRLAGEPWTVHATGRIGAGSTAEMMCLDVPGDVVANFTSEALYALTARLGLQYGPAFQTVAQVHMHQDGNAIVELVTTSKDRALSGYLTDPARLDGALQGLVALAARRFARAAPMASEVALLPWRIGRVRLADASGARVACARLRLNRVGPRSISADVALLDVNGKVVASLGDCWFTQVGGVIKSDLAAHLFHSINVSRPRMGATPALIRPPICAAVVTSSNDEASMLVDAFIATAILPAIMLLADSDGQLRPADLVFTRQVHEDSAQLLMAALCWLERDDLAICEDGLWTLMGSEDLPAAAEIWRSLLAGSSAAVAELALMATLSEAFPKLLSVGEIALPLGLAALTSHMLTASPTARAARDAIVASLVTLRRSWPRERPLRVLELGAADGAITASFVQSLRRSGLTVSYVAAVATDVDPQVIALAASALAGATAVLWNFKDEPPGVIASGEFDLVIGAFAVARAKAGPETLARIQTLMTEDGILLLAEPEPNRVWDFRFAMDPAWLSADGTSPALLDRDRWIHRLHAQGFTDTSVTTIWGGLWAASLISSLGHGLSATRPSKTLSAAPLLICSELADPLATALADVMLAGGRNCIQVGPDFALREPQFGSSHAGDIVYVVPDTVDATEIRASIARSGAALGAWATALCETKDVRLWVVARADPPNDMLASALRGVVRVLANEAPNLCPRFLRVDRALPDGVASSLVAAEINAPDGETEVELSPNTRMVPRLRRGLGDVPLSDASAAAHLAVGQPGLLDTLHWATMTPHAPGANEVGIRVAASGLNFRDVMWSMGLLPDEALLDGLAGATLGLECSGTVTAIGEDVVDVRVGDRVMAIAPACLSTHVVAPVQAVVRLPDGVDFVAAATVPVAFLTACYALGTLANLQPGERVLIHGGAGGVGLAAIQYARHRGAIIFATAGSPAKRAFLRLLGVDHVFDTRSLAFADDVMAATGGQGVDVVLNSLAGEAMERSVGVLRPFGRFLELGKRDLYGNTPLGLRALRHNASYFAIDADQLPVQRPDVAKRVFAEIQDLMERGILRPLPYRLFRFSEATDAFRLMQASGHIGKIVLEPDHGGLHIPKTHADWRPSAAGTVLVSGGLAGFGLQTAKWLVEKGVRSLALIGRRGLATLGASEALADFAAQGVIARAFACDVSDEAALGLVLSEIRNEMLPLRGVVHAAMVLDDALLSQLTEARFAAVLQPKLAGAQLLDRLTREDPIELFLLFSSITTVLGNPGQATYVAANAGMEALAAMRRRSGLPGMSIGWGPIADVGYLAREQAVSDALAHRMGEMHLSSHEALALLPALLASGQSHIDVARLRWGAMRQHLPHLNTPYFSDVIHGQANTDPDQVDFATRLAECTPDEALALVVGVLVEEVSAITKAPSSQIDLNRSLIDIGMDSLMALELRMSLERRFGNNLPLLSLADGASISAIAARIARQLSTNVAEGTVDATASMLAKYETDADIEPDEGDLEKVPELERNLAGLIST